MPNEAKLIAQLHEEALDKSFLGSLGVPFLTLLYEAMIDDHKTIVLFECDEVGLIGFVSGGVHLGRIYLSLLRRPFKLMWSLRAVLVSARKIRGVFEILSFSAFKRLRRQGVRWSKYVTCSRALHDRYRRESPGNGPVQQTL